MALIKNRTLVQDSWQRLDAAADGAEIAPFGDILVPLAVWKARREELLARIGRVGVVLAGSDDPADIAADLAQLHTIAIDFPKVGDGRGYSIARLLRERYAWRGELRAVGDIQRDQLSFLERCGFDTLELRAGEDVATALTAFHDFSEQYQGDVHESLPLFRRRARAA